MCVKKEKCLCHLLGGENFEVLIFYIFRNSLSFFSSTYLGTKHLEKVLKFTKQDKNMKK